MHTSAGAGLLWNNHTRSIQDHSDGVTLSVSGHTHQLRRAASAAQALFLLSSTLDALLGNPAVPVFTLDIIGYRSVQGYGEVLEYVP